MRLGKVKESILKRSVLRQLHTHGQTGSPGYGEDAGFFPVEEAALIQQSISRLIAVSVNPVEGWTLAARRIVYGAVNSLAAAGAVPEGIAPVILMPAETEEGQLKELMREIDALCRQEGMYCLAGHTAVSPFVSNLVVSTTALGQKTVAPGSADSQQKTSPDGLISPQAAAVCPDMDIIVAGTVGREGAAVMACESEKELLSRYPAFFVEEAKCLFNDGSMGEAAALARKSGVIYVHDVREGGIFAGLWELAASAGTGIDIALKNIPIRQHTIEVCEFFRLNPYMLRSGGTLLMVSANGERAAAALCEAGIPAAVIGRTTGNNDKIIRYDDEVRYLEPPKEDELLQYYKCINGGDYA
ncbi:MAG TPA: hydrogenase maturation factor [Candidatus Anaerobutyricum stercoris]|uniref:Hydrogenase maturation factor n=1 Tax=Candidatus Anaerobutyricum stercoris TaxID=2838457 RepID=A0A9D2EJ58_9FIRM|nr:thiamine monophosphate kinase [Eubacteriaceae bacterium CHKCI004]HIZ38350.1 hydrogenase maturation factor [Candidatus Anaerobutyricum stercoris]